MNEYFLIAKTTLLELAIPLTIAFVIATAIGSYTSRAMLGRRRLSRVVVFCNMFAIYGVVLGFLIGNSKDSIAKDALSAVVTILSGYFAYLIAKDLSPRLKAMIPAGVIAFLLCLVITTAFMAKLQGAFQG